MMKNRKILSSIGAVALGLCCLSACTSIERTEPLTFNQIEKNEKASLNKGMESPFCEVKVNYQYINSPKDSINQLITQQINCQVLGEEYQALQPEAAVDSFIHHYVRSYQQEVSTYYHEEIQRGTDASELPGWYNYTYELNTEAMPVGNELLNYGAKVYTYQGGPHPNEWEYWMCFDQQTGKKMRIENVIARNHTEEVKELILRELIKIMAEMNPGEKIRTVDDLIRLNLPSFGELFLPENFKMDKDSITFLYNKYDIAPYVFGKFIVTLPLKELEPFMIQERN